MRISRKWYCKAVSLLCSAALLVSGNGFISMADTEMPKAAEETEAAVWDSALRTAVPVASGSDADDVDGGTIAGTDVTWSYNKSSRTLKLEGSGRTPDYSGKGKQPWKAYNSEIETVVIGEGITGLGSRAFYPSEKLTTVIWPEGDSLTEIAEGVFRNCTALQYIEIPESVKTLGRAQFYEDTALTEAVLGGSYEVLDEIVFGGCTSLESVTIPASVKKLSGEKSKATFYKASAPKEIAYGGSTDDWKRILATDDTKLLLDPEITVTCTDGEYHYAEGDENTVEPELPGEFSGTFEGTEVTWSFDPESGTLLIGGKGAMPDYKSTDARPYDDFKDQVKKAVIGDQITKVGTRAFYRYVAMTEIEYPTSGALAELGEGSVRESGLIEIETPESIGIMGRAQFAQCASLEKAVLNGSFTEIPDAMFYECSALSFIRLPASVKSFAASATNKVFKGCERLTSIEYGGTISEWAALLESNSTASAFLKKDSITVRCSNGDFIYGTHILDGDVTYSVSGGVLTIQGKGGIPDYDDGSQAPWAADAAGITTVVIHSGIERIGANAFAGFDSLREVYYIGYRDGWDSLKAASGEGNDALFGCGVILGTEGTCGAGAVWRLDIETQTLTISGFGPMDNFSSAADQPWYYSAGGLKALVVEEGITTLGDYAFSSCKSLTEITLPHSLEILGTYTFSACTGIEELILPEGLRIIGSKTFQNCSGLRSVWLPVSLKYIDMKAFEKTILLKNVYYAGTGIQWGQLQISRQALGNEYLLNASRTCMAQPEPVADRYEDVAAGAWFADAIQYLTDHGWLSVESPSFGTEEAMAEYVVLDILYRRDGESAAFASAEDWALQTGIFEADLDGAMTFTELAGILYRTALYNGMSPEASMAAAIGLNSLAAETAADDQAADWCREKGFTREMDAAGIALNGDTVLTRAQASVILAAYMKDEVSSADRYAELTARVRGALAQGGDGNLYILTPKKFENVDKNTTKCGDCTVLIFPQGSTMMIDGGSDHCSGPIKKLLDDIGIVTLDYIVLSHPHSDHVGGIKDVAEYIYQKGGSVGHYYAAPVTHSTEGTLRSYLTEKGTSIHFDVKVPYEFPVIDGVRIDIYNPSEEMVDSVNAMKAAGVSLGDADINNISILMKLSYGESTYLTGGDLYAARERALAGELGGVLQADMMKTNHHGTYTSTCEEWLDAVRPLFAVSDADDNGSQVLAEEMQRRGIRYYAEGLDGLVMFVLDGTKNYQAWSQYESGLRRDYDREPDPEIDEPGYGGGTVDPDDPQGPDEPDDPQKPDKPDDPQKPDKPDDPQKPDDPEVPQRPDDSGQNNGYVNIFDDTVPLAAAPEAVTANGTWDFDGTGWRFRYEDGTYAVSKWERLLYDGQVDWYYFDEKSYMLTGWFDWDGFRFYLNPKSDGWLGRMLTGWSEIDGKWYYFEPVSGSVQGHLYLNGWTTDGHHVAADGSWDGKSK